MNEEGMNDIWEMLNNVIENIGEDQTISLKNTIQDMISCYDEDYANEVGINKFNDEDIGNIVFYVLDNNSVRFEIQKEIEEYASSKNTKEE